MRVLDAQGREPRSEIHRLEPDCAPTSPSARFLAVGTPRRAVRIDMPNPYSVYMHDTSHKELFSRDYRFQSSAAPASTTRAPSPPGSWPTIRLAGARSMPASPGRAPRHSSRPQGPGRLVYLTGWVTRDQTIHFRDDVYGRDETPTLVADARPQIASAARASGFVLQSAATRSPPRPVSYLDSQ
jgi:hypothetical protein